MAGLLFDELDSGRWQRAFITGINQDGKSLLGFVIPTLYTLFERKETVILGVPSDEIAADKWKLDLLPVINACRYKEFLPQSGSGSRGGDPSMIQFRHGPALRFMTSGGDDQSRSSFTTPNLMVTETDGFDEVGSSSREGTKFAQLERRLLAFGSRGRTIAECTVSTEQGRTWQEYQRGSQSRIALPCPHCSDWVTPEREHFIGWQDAEDEVAAAANAHLVCPSCGAEWTNEQRIEANRKCLLVHKGQKVESGTVVGDLPRTNTLGFRWTVVNSALNPERMAQVAVIEWKAKRSTDEDAAERDLVQSQWATPAKPAKVDVSQLDAAAIMRRIDPRFGRGILPPDTVKITIGCDIGRWLCHWTAIAWRPRGTPHVIAYDRIEVPSGMMAEEEAIRVALCDWRDNVVSQGWGGRPVDMTFVDCGYLPDVVIPFCKESGYFAAKGFGVGQRRGTAAKRETGSVVVARYDHYAEVRLPGGDTIVEVNADYWKSKVHARVRTPAGASGALMLFDSNQHLSWVKHLLSERQVQEFVAGEGTIDRWETVSGNNHYFDSTSLAFVAGNAVGVRLDEDPAPPPPLDEPPRAVPARREASSFVNNWRGRS